MGGHVGRLNEDYSFPLFGIMLSSIIVHQEDVATGHMAATNLAGFCEGARKLGFKITDEEAFMREQQTLVFAWAQTNDAA
jgi:hypothetical protein